MGADYILSAAALSIFCLMASGWASGAEENNRLLFRLNILQLSA